MTAAWGLGLPGILAGLYLVFRRQLDAVAISLGLSIALMLITAFRYTSNEWYGPHYHVVAAVLVAWLIAAVINDIRQLVPSNRWRTWLLVVIAAVVVASGLQQWRLRYQRVMVMPEQLSAVSAGRALREIALPDDIIVVRSSARAHSARFSTENNYQDPIVFYVAGLRGWALPADEPRLEELDEALRAGARFYVDLYGQCVDADLARWLQVHSAVVRRLSPSITIYSLEPGM